MHKKFINSVVVLALLVGMISSVAVGAPAEAPGGEPGKPDDLPHPLGDRQRAALSLAKQEEIKGNAFGLKYEVARGQFVELARRGEDSIWTVLGEFSDFNHNNIAEPNRSDPSAPDYDNTTYWVQNFNRGHYLDILFSEEKGVSSMRNFYIELSSNRYTVNGDVTPWVEVPGTAASYDDDAGALALWSFLQDSVDGWYDMKVADGWTAADFENYLSQFDTWDRYDYDGDGNFDEPDGYIDHFQSVHSGEGEEAGGGALGGAAIWSHRWYAAYHLIGSVGSPYVKFGGLQIGDTDYWIGDYTIEPENGGVGVFAHEFAHDLGLPDLYSTSGGENGTGFWTLMSSGSWLSADNTDIGTKPGHMGGWEKFMLGWLNYEVAYAGQTSAHKLGPSMTNTKQAQGVFVVLPKKAVTTQIADPYAGSYFFYSGSGNNMDNYMYKSYNLPAGSTFAAKVNYDIEVDWDYAYLVVSTDGGASWTSVNTNLSTTDDPNGQNFGYGIMGHSAGWVDLTADLSAFTGDVLVGFRYWTDGYVAPTGFMADEISVNGGTPEGAESDTGWVLDGFRITGGQETGYFNNYYLAEYRVYRGYDKVLNNAYNFGFTNTQGNRVEHFPYQDGLLVSYWDTSYADNRITEHPGGGLILPIDAHPDALYMPAPYNNYVWRNRVQTYDSTFTLNPTDALTLHLFGIPSYIPSLAAAKVFNDNILYWDPANPTGSVKNPHTGTKIKIKGISAQGNFMEIVVTPVQ